MAPRFKNVRKVSAERTVVLMCDMQEGYRHQMPVDKFVRLCTNVNRMILAAHALEIPVIATIFYPSDLGPITQELDMATVDAVIPRTKYTMIVPQVEARIAQLFPNKMLSDVILFGLECHMSVEQTALDLIARGGRRVFILADCCGARMNQDRDWALSSLTQFGCTVMTYESVVYNIMQDKEHPKYEIIRRLFLEPAKDMELCHYTSR